MSAAALAGGGLLSAPPATARPLPLAPTAPCVQPARSQVPSARQHADTPPVTAADLGALPERQQPDELRITRRQATGPAPLRTGSRNSAVILPAHVRVPVFVHVIRGAHRGERPRAGHKVVRRWIRHLNEGFHGAQSTTAPDTRYTFVLKHIDYHKRESWWHARPFDSADRQMRRKLHRRGPRTLNLYITGGRPGTLGWSRFPWQYSRRPQLDGVTVTRRAFPGGSARGYNHGDTLVHETGHWMGLLHTFQGGCTGSGDLVADTPAEAVPSFYCEVGRDTCSQPGTDPVHNFMDYSLDRCMDTFTAGQAVRMDRAWLRYRAPRQAS
ncbi:MAG TPA: zinc metalloprotease [Marmoricola sp.]|nr:zinc metalloprotease [Marmoricola sp.]